MTTEQSKEYRTKAEEFRSVGDYQACAKYYALASYSYLGDFEYQDPNMIGTATDLGLGIYCLQQAALAFRLGENEGRAENHARRGVLIAEDFRDGVFQDEVLIGLAWEWIGDFRTLANLTGAEDAYRSAENRYATVEHVRGWLAETVFEYSLETFIEVSNASDDGLESEQTIEMGLSFDTRINHKASRFDALLRDIEQADKPVSFSFEE